VRDRRAEERDDGVADELLHRAAEALELRSAGRWWYGASSARTSSGSICSARDVKPTRSAKTTVMTLRSSRAGASSNGFPHEKQKRAPAGFSCPQFGQRIGEA
jgi:hypothetical protein